MTNEFLSRTGVLDEYATGSIYEKMDVIEVSLAAISEGVTDNRVVSTALSYTQSMHFEILENVKNGLLKMVQQALSALNSYYINNAKLCKKYRDVIAAGLAKSSTTILHETYIYPSCKGYPRSIRSASIESDVVRLQKDVQSHRYDGEEIAYRVDDMIESFGKKVLDFTPDPWNLKESVHEIVERRVRGQKTTITITVDTIDDWIKDITDYRRDRDDLMAMKKDISEDYEILKRTLGSATKPGKMVPGRTELQRAYDPEAENFYQHEYSRYADIHTEMMRMFNGFITVYREAFDARIKLLDEKINDQRNTLNEVLTRTGKLAVIKCKSPYMDGNRTIPYNPQPVS